MNLKTIAQSAVAKAFTVADSLLVSCSYRQPGTVSYAASTGTVTPDYGTTAIDALFTLFEAKETDSAAKREGERRVLVKRSELAAVTPSLADAIVDGSTVWQILAIEDDKESTEALYAFIVKRGQS